MADPFSRAVDPSSAEESRKTMPNHLIPQHKSDPIPSSFWSVYERVAKQHDEDFLEMHYNNLDVILIYAGLFSGVSSAFIINMSSGLSPNPSDTTNVLLKLLINKVNPGTFSDQDVALPVWTGPSYTIVWVQSLAYTSLSISLLVGVGAVLGKQWLGSFKTSRFGHGSLKERCIRRQQKLDGLEIWRFDALMSFIPSCLQLSLLFFGIALSADMWSFQKTIAYVIIGCTVCGQGLYILTLVAAVKYPDCPYQTLVSMFIVEVWKRLWNPRPGTLWDHVKKTMTTYSRLWRRQRAQTVHLGYLPTMVSVLPKQPSPGVLYLNHSPPQPVEAHAVRWIFDVSTDGDILTDAAKMVAEVEWPQESDITSVANRLQSQLKACFDPTQQLLPIAEDRALACLKALCHCFLKIPIRDDNYKHHSAIYSAISKYRNIFLSDTAFLLISGIICKEGVTDINSISSSDRMWLAHLIPYCLHQGRCGKDSDWRDVVIMFTAACLRDPHSPSRLVVDCLISAGLLMGLLVDQTQLAKLDKSEESEVIPRLLISLEKRMDSLSSHVDETSRRCRVADYLNRLRNTGNC